ncbi:Hypothetical predicted protein [Olea europaea subsp. europaea]|uniref:Uncharacterized protein n=1 Tax=Olea europaea subsp. europaea TaxID=158383 RepID=A0A8S0SPS3_OLEEU|nr:Hypothetical predicted protein [Olea europaea subsp. europaea]
MAYRSSICRKRRLLKIFGSQLKSWEIEQTHMRFLDSFKTPTLRLKALRESPGLTQEIIDNPQKSIGPIEKGFDAFEEMRHRFLSFKKDKYFLSPSSRGSLQPEIPKPEFPPLPELPTLPKPEIPGFPKPEFPDIPELPKPSFPSIPDPHSTTNP